MSLIGSKSTRPNSIPKILLKQTRNTDFLPLAKLRNKYFERGIFRDRCEVSKEVPIFKSETRLLCNNYRLLSFFSNIGNIIEKLMHQRLIFFLKEYSCYYPFQFGFRLNYSTNSALISILENI